MSIVVKTLCIVVAAMGLNGCLMTGLSKVESDPEFDWHAIKRDQIVMTPLVDLRKEAKAPDGHRSKLAFFTEQESRDYAEIFKQRFYKLRKDIRVFGAGGAFEHLAGQSDIALAAEKIINRQPLEQETWYRLVGGAQDIRFVFFFALVGEQLYYDYSYTAPSEERDYATKTYIATRSMTVKMALWDSLKNKTVWIGTQIMTPAASNTVDLPKKKNSTTFGKMFLESWSDSSSLDNELRQHMSRFPNFPGREPTLTSNFDDFALAFPLNPSEENLIEYSWFTYHRPELGLRWTTLGSSDMPLLQLGSSSILYNRYRLGFAMLFPLAEPVVEYQSKKYEISAFHFGPSFDLEWALSERIRLLTGAMIGSVLYSIKESDETQSAASERPEEKKESQTDGAHYVWPRAMLLFGGRQGFQWSLGVAWRAFDTIEEPILKANRPSAWSADASIAYTFRGF